MIAASCLSSKPQTFVVRIALSLSQMLFGHSAAAFPRQEAHADWQRFESDSDVQRDQFGPKASPLRLYCPVEDYVLREDVSGFSRERLAGTKAKARPQGKDIEGIDKGLQEDMPKWSDERLNIGDFDGKTSNPFLLQGGHALRTPQAVGSLTTAARQGGGQQSQPAPGDNQKHQARAARDVERQRNKKYDEAQQSLAKESKAWSATLASASDTLAKFLLDNQRDDYTHFLALAEARLKVLCLMLASDTKREDLDVSLAALTEDEKTCLPCDTSLLLLPGEICEKCKKILLAADHDSLKACKEAISSDIQHMGHLSRGVAGAVADLGKAKDRRVKDHNREVEKEKRKQQLLKDKENKKAKTHAEKESAAQHAEAKQDPHRIDKLPFGSMTRVVVLKTMEEVSKMDSGTPFIVRNAEKLEPKIQEAINSEQFQNGHKNFQNSYRSSTAAKTTGRAQCGCTPAELHPALRSALRTFTPWSSSQVTEAVPTGNTVSMWGCIEHMNFVSSEFESVGQLRLLLTGGKQTIAAPACDVMEAMQKNGLAVDSDQAVYKFFRNLTEKQLETGNLRLMIFMTIAGDVTYMPCGWVMADFCTDETTGLRVSSICPQDCVSGNVEALCKLKSTASSHKDNMNKYLEAAKKVIQVP